MELKESFKEQFSDSMSFGNYLQIKFVSEELKSNIKDLDFLDGYSQLVKDNPKIIKLKELFEPRILKKMKEHFVEYDKDLTKRNVLSYISGYKKRCRKPCVPMYYFFTDEDVDNFLFECFENGLGEIFLPRTIVVNGKNTFPFIFIDVINRLIDDFCEETISTDIKTITKKLIQIHYKEWNKSL